MRRSAHCLRLLSVLAAAHAAPAALALEFGSLGEAAIMYDGPSLQAGKRFVAAAGTPVEVVVALPQWVKVREAGGDIVWIERRVLSASRNVIVTAPAAQVRRQPSEDAPAAYSVERDVLLELQDGAPPGWVKVRHRSAGAGYARVAEVWGE